jgi:hypothetical protein
MEALMKALGPKKAGAPGSKEPVAPAAEEKGEDLKQIAKDAAKDGDFDAMIDALCAYLGH